MAVKNLSFFSFVLCKFFSNCWKTRKPHQLKEMTYKEALCVGERLDPDVFLGSV